MGVRDRISRLRDADEKFTKGQAYYIGNATSKPFRCANCYHYQNGQCRIVTGEGEPTEGRIDPQGACALYNARGLRIQLYQNLWGRGVFDGVAPEVGRATAFILTYSFLGEEIPEDIREKALFSPEQLPGVLPEPGDGPFGPDNPNRSGDYEEEY